MELGTRIRGHAHSSSRVCLATLLGSCSSTVHCPPPTARYLRCAPNDASLGPASSGCNSNLGHLLTPATQRPSRQRRRYCSLSCRRPWGCPFRPFADSLPSPLRSSSSCCRRHPRTLRRGAHGCATEAKEAVVATLAAARPPLAARSLRTRPNPSAPRGLPNKVSQTMSSCLSTHRALRSTPSTHVVSSCP